MLALVRRVGNFLYVLCRVTAAIKKTSGRLQVLMLRGDSVVDTCHVMNILSVKC